MYTVQEDQGTLNIRVTRSGATDTQAVALVATDAFEATALG